MLEKLNNFRRELEAKKRKVEEEIPNIKHNDWHLMASLQGKRITLSNDLDKVNDMIKVYKKYYEIR